MVFIESDSLNVIPGCGLVAKEALADIRMLDAGHSFGDHVEMHHVMARRSLMTLGAIF